MAVQGVDGSIDILLQYTDNLDTLLTSAKQKVKTITRSIGDTISDRVDLEKQLQYYVDLGFDGRKKENRELQTAKKIIQDKLKLMKNSASEAVKEAQSFALAGGELNSIKNTLAALHNGHIISPAAITSTIKALKDIQIELGTTGSIMNQLQSATRQPMIKTYGSFQGSVDSSAINTTHSSMTNFAKPNMVSVYETEQRRIMAILNEGQTAITTHYDKVAAKEKQAANDYIAQANMVMTYERELAKTILDERRKRAGVLSSLIDQKYSELDKDKASQSWYNKTYVDVAPVTKYKEALERLDKEKDLGRITTEQYANALAIESKRLNEGMKALSTASEAQAKLNKQTAEQRATSFTREYESTPALNKYNDALGKLNSLKNDGIITAEQYNAALSKEKVELDSVNTTASLTSRQRAEGFRVIDGETKQLKGLTLQWHDFKDAMQQTDGGSTFGKKIGTTAQYMAAGTMIYGVASAFQALGTEIVQFDTFSRTAAAAMDMTHAEGVKLGQQLLNLSGAMGGTNAEIQGVAMELGRAGVKFNDIAGATEVVMRMARLTGDTFAESTKAIVAYQTVFGNTYSIEQLGDKLATVANVSRLTTHDIGTFSNYALAASQTIGLSIDSLGALAASFSNAGVNASTSGTSVRRFGTMLTSTDKEVVAFFDSLGVNQANMLAKMTSGVESSNKTMIEFLQKLGTVSDEEFQKMISGMDILAANTLTMMRNNSNEIVRLIKVSSDESAGMLANTNIILEGYQVSWERIINNIKSIFINMFNEVSGHWLPRFVQTTANLLNQTVAMIWGSGQDYGNAMKKTWGQIKANDIYDAKEAGDLRKVAILTQDLVELNNAQHKIKTKTLDATKVLLQAQLQSLQVQYQSGQIGKDEYNQKFKALQLSFKQADSQKTSISMSGELLSLHDKQYAQALEYIKLIKVEKDPKVKNALQAQLANVQIELTKTQNQIKGVVDQTSKLNATMDETGGIASGNNKTLDAQIALFKSSASSGIALKYDYEEIRKSLVESKTAASNFSTILSDKDISANVKNQVNAIINGADSINTKASKLKTLSKDIILADPKSAHIVDSVARGYQNVLSIEKQIVDVDRAWTSQNTKKGKSAQKLHDYTLDMQNAQDKQQELLDAISGKEITAVQIAERKRDIALESYINAAHAAKTDKDRLDVELRRITFLEAELNLIKTTSDQNEKDAKAAADKLNKEREITALKNQSKLIYSSSLAQAEKEVDLAKETWDNVQNTTQDAAKRHDAEKAYLTAVIKVNEEKRKEHELEKQISLEKDKVNNETKYLNQTTSSTITLLQMVNKYSKMPTTYIETAISTYMSLNKQIEANEHLQKMSLSEIYQEFKVQWGNSLSVVGKAQTDITDMQKKIIEGVVYEAQEQDRNIKVAQDKVTLTEQLLEIQGKVSSSIATQGEMNLLILNGNRSQNDLEKEKLELQKAQNEKLKTQAGIVNELYSIKMKDDPRAPKFQYTAELAKIKEQMKGYAGWTDSDSERVALERSKTDWDKYMDGLGNKTEQTKQIIQNAFSRMEDSIVEFAKTGKFSFRDFANAVLEDLLRMIIRMNITQQLAAAMGSYFGIPMAVGASGGQVPTSSTTTLASGGPIPVKNYAYGGKLTGGTGFKDDLYLGSASGSHVFAMGGEYILNRQATNKIGPATLDYMNQTGNVPSTGNTTAVIINIENKSGQPLAAEKMSEYTRQNSRGEQEKVINFVIDGVNRNLNGARDILKGLR